MKTMNIKKYYTERFPDDELGNEIKDDVTFLGLLDILFRNLDVYDYVGVGDSLVRERVFEGLSQYSSLDYSFIYDLWLQKNK